MRVILDLTLEAGEVLSRLTMKVSLPSAMVSPVTAIVMVWLIWPAAKFRKPPPPARSRPACAVPLAIRKPTPKAPVPPVRVSVKVASVSPVSPSVTVASEIETVLAGSAARRGLGLM